MPILQVEFLLNCALKQQQDVCIKCSNFLTVFLGIPINIIRLTQKLSSLGILGNLFVCGNVPREGAINVLQNII